MLAEPPTPTTATLPVFRMVLSYLAHVLDKAAASAEQRKFSPDVFVGVRLAPAMLPFAAQLRIACDAAKDGTARVGGLDAPKFADDDTTFAELQSKRPRRPCRPEGAPFRHRRPNHPARGLR